MKILIIGATGMLAKPVINHLAEADYSLRLFSRSINKDDFTETYDISKGDIFNDNDLKKAIDGCDAIHINLSKIDEGKAVEKVVSMAKQSNIKLISYISGASVAEKNRWFEMIDNKYRAEQVIMQSGIPYLIFRPTWFFESLELMVRDGKAIVIGKQKKPYQWIAADDYARMLTTAYQDEKMRNKIFYIVGKEKYTMRDALALYCEAIHPRIKKVTTMPVWLLRLIAKLTGNDELKNATDLFAYFEKVNEFADGAETNQLLGEPEITFQKWLDMKKDEKK